MLSSWAKTSISTFRIFVNFAHSMLCKRSLRLLISQAAGVRACRTTNRCGHRPNILRQLSGARHPQHRSKHVASSAAGSSTYQAMAGQKAAPVGEWETPITSQLITSQSIRLGAPLIGPDGSIYWMEGRPQEGGRQVLVRRTPEGHTEDVTPGQEAGINVRTTVHEYGGGEYVAADGAVYFSNFKDQRLYRQAVSPAVSAPEPLTPEGKKLRYADGVVDAARQRIITVQEDHSGGGEAVNTIAAVSLETGESSVLVSGADFYASPRLSPDGSRLAWVCWRHPNMPWDDTELWTADVAPDGSLSGHALVAGGKDESVMQPLWTPQGDLVFISDRSGFWNLYRQPKGGGTVQALLRMDAEFGGPAWAFGQRSYQVLPDGRLLCLYSDPKEAGMKLAVLDDAGQLHPLNTPYSSYGSISVARSGSSLALATVGGSPTRASEAAVLFAHNVDGLIRSQPGDWQVLRKSAAVEVDEGYLSVPRAVEFPTEGGLTAYMNFYAPRNKDYGLPPGELPPLLIKIHGGPTSQASTGFSLSIQYWTSRGYAIADVNYGGSTGYGRAYRNRLRGQWGVVDVDDCANAAEYLAKQGLVDPKRLCISGGSAGGYTTLAALAFKQTFAVGVSHYGVADCELLAQETHKFESRYLDLLIGPYPAEQALYKKRSPINYRDSWRIPTAFFHGLEDAVVPPNQAQIMYDGIKARGLPTALVMFPGEQHGFRSAGAIRRALDGEFFFYGTVLGFKAAMPPDLEPVPVDNV